MIDPFNVKMMPGQLPYTKEELTKLYQLISDANDAEEIFTLDELEDIVVWEAIPGLEWYPVTYRVKKQ